MTTAYTSLLGLALPVTGELNGTWGDVVNNSITNLLDSAIAGTTTLSTDADVTLTTTTGSANQAREAILLCSGARTAARNITAPAQSKIYTVINATTGGYAVTIRGVGPTTGITIPAGQTAVVAWNGSDFVDAGNYTNGNGYINGNLTVVGYATIQGMTVGKGTGAVFTNTAVGASAIFTGTVTGVQAVGVGYLALRDLSSGNYNTGVGAYAGYKITSGGNNTAIGNSALAALTTGTNNTALGYLAGYTTNGTLNTYIGEAAGKVHTGDYSTFIGGLAGTQATTGSANTAVGYGSMYSTVAGDYNTAVGRASMYNNTGSYNTAIGYQALTNGTGNYNIAIGGSALQNITTGTNNVAIGVNAGLGGNAVSSTIIGSSAGYSINGSGPLTAIGFEAGYSYTGAGTGSTTFVGWGAGRGGGLQNNTAIGTSSLYSLNSSADSSTALGAAAGYNSTGSYNTFIGQNSGNEVTSGYSHTILGRYNGYSYNLDIRTANNYIVLSDGTGRPQMHYAPSGDGIWKIGVPNQSAAQPYLYLLNSSGGTPGSGTDGLILSNGKSGAPVQVYASSQSWDALSIYYGGSVTTKLGIEGSNTGFLQTTIAGQSTGAIFRSSGVAFTPQSAAGASSNANTLDAYEEGTWTPVVNRSTGVPTVSYNNRSGSYTRIGNMVTVFWDLSVASISGGSGSPTLSNLPFAVWNSQAGYSVVQHRDANAFNSGYFAGSQIKGFAQQGQSFLVIQQDNSGTSGYGTGSDPAWAAGRSTGYCTYQCSA